MTARSPYDTLITVYGGSGFLGRHVVRALAKRHYRIRVAVRRPELANFLQPLGRVGQIHAVQANLRNAPSVEAAARDARVLINLVGVLFERGRQRFDAVHAYGAEQVALAANAHGARMVHVSAIGADANSSSAYARTKANAEQLVLAAQPSTVIMRPSILFGPEDDFFNRFAALSRMSPALPLIGGGLTRFQPAFVGDVAAAIADAVDGKARASTVYELGGPDDTDVQRTHAICSRNDRAQAASGQLAVFRCQVAGDTSAISPEAVAHTRSGRTAPHRQRCVGSRKIRDANVSGPRHRT